jgi:predicted nucleic acid-binding protein
VSYADTSALVKLLVDEPETANLRTYLTSERAQLLSSELTVAELERVAGRAGVIVAATETLLGQVSLLALDRPALTRAGRLPSPAGTFLRTADAIHIVAAIELGATTFLSYDRRQAQAAEASGLTVVAPGRPTGWHR